MEIECNNCKADFIVTGADARFCVSCGSADITKVTLGIDTSKQIKLKRVKIPVNEDGTSQRLEIQQEPVECVASAPATEVDKCEAPKTDEPEPERWNFNCGAGEDWGLRTKSEEFNFTYKVQEAPEQGTDEWLGWRKSGITATEAAAIAFPDQYGSPLKVYTDKLGITQNDQSDENGFFKWGHIIEDDLVKEFSKRHPEAGVVVQGELFERDWAKCSLDARCIMDGKPCIIECKTSQSIGKWNPYPDRYFAQVQWQMYVTGIRKAIIVALVSENGWHYIEREVEYSPKFVEELLFKCLDVHTCVMKKTPPATLGDFTPDKKAISALAGESGHCGENATTDRETFYKYKQLKETADKAVKEFEDFKNSLAYQMMDSPRMTCEGKSFISWVERKGSTKIDSNKLKELYPEAYEACMTEGLPSRYLKFNDKLNFD